MPDPSNLPGTTEINTNNVKENVVTKFLSPSSPIQKVLYMEKNNHCSVGDHMTIDVSSSKDLNTSSTQREGQSLHKEE